MRKFLIFAPIVVFGDTLQEAYQDTLKDILEESPVIFNSFLLLFALFGAFFLLMIIKFRKNSQIIKKQSIVSSTIISLKNSARITQTPLDIVRMLDMYFLILNQKAAQNNNIIFFSFNPNWPRHLNVDSVNIAPMFFFLVEFLLAQVKSANIIIGLRLKNNNESSVAYEFFVKCDKILPDMKKGDVQSIVKSHNFLAYKKLAEAEKIAKRLKIAINYAPYQRHSIFSFSYVFNKNLNKAEQGIKKLKDKNAIILESSKAGFYNLSMNLSKLGINTQLSCDLDLAKQHLFSIVFSPDYVFINTKILRSFTKEDMEKFQVSYKNHKFKIILVSDNALFKDYSLENEQFYLLSQPFSIETLKAAIDISPPPQASRVIK